MFSPNFTRYPSPGFSDSKSRDLLRRGFDEVEGVKPEKETLELGRLMSWRDTRGESGLIRYKN